MLTPKIDPKSVSGTFLKPHNDSTAGGTDVTFTNCELGKFLEKHLNVWLFQFQDFFLNDRSTNVEERLSWCEWMVHIGK